MRRRLLTTIILFGVCTNFGWALQGERVADIAAGGQQAALNAVAAIYEPKYYDNLGNRVEGEALISAPEGSLTKREIVIGNATYIGESNFGSILIALADPFFDKENTFREKRVRSFSLKFRRTTTNVTTGTGSYKKTVSLNRDDIAYRVHPGTGKNPETRLALIELPFTLTDVSPLKPLNETSTIPFDSYYMVFGHGADNLSKNIKGAEVPQESMDVTSGFFRFTPMKFVFHWYDSGVLKFLPKPLPPNSQNDLITGPCENYDGGAPALIYDNKRGAALVAIHYRSHDTCIPGPFTDKTASYFYDIRNPVTQSWISKVLNSKSRQEPGPRDNGKPRELIPLNPTSFRGPKPASDTEYTEGETIPKNINLPVYPYRPEFKPRPKTSTQP